MSGRSASRREGAESASLFRKSGARFRSIYNKVSRAGAKRADLGLFSSAFAKKMLDESGKTGYDVVGYKL